MSGGRAFFSSENAISRLSGEAAAWNRRDASACPGKGFKTGEAKPRAWELVL